MKIPYKKLVDGDREFVRIEHGEIEYCCDEMADSFCHMVTFEIDPDWSDEDIFVGIVRHKGMGMDVEALSFEFCPFCGDALDAWHLGRFKRVTEEVQVDG